MLSIGKALSYALSLPIHSDFKSLIRNRILASNTAGYVEVTSCSDGSFCCGHSNSSCCNDGQGYKINAKGQVTGSQATPTAMSSTTASSIPSVSSAKGQGGDSNSLSKNQQIALAVAIPTVTVVVALLAWCWPKVGERNSFSKQFARALSKLGSPRVSNVPVSRVDSR